MSLVTPSEIVADLDSLLLSPPPQAHASITGFSIDTRTLAPGDLFLALPGETTDGHFYVNQAFEKGASAALITHFPSNIPDHASFPFFHVSQINQALTALAQGARTRAARASIVGLTGSVGKTGTKEALLHVLSPQGFTHSSVASFNNHWGTPISLARMPRDTRFGIFEMGMNHPGEIAPLSQLARPHVALITRIGAAHKGFFAGPEDIACAKAEIFSGVEKGGMAILNHDDPFFPYLTQKAKAYGLSSFLSFGEADTSDIKLMAADLQSDYSFLEVVCCGERLSGRLAYPGRHWVLNALGVLAVCRALDLPLSECMERLSTLPPLPGRGRRLTLSWNNKHLTFLDESYNANPTSMRAALELLAQQRHATRRIAVLGDMLELGETEIQDHQELLDALLTPDIDVIFTCGPLMQYLNDCLPSSKRGRWAPDVHALLPQLHTFLEDGDLIMIKGSRRMKLEKIIET